VFTGSFGSPGSGAGQFGEAVGVAVNEATGDVYVLDKANDRVEIFNANGSKFEGEFNGSGLGLGILGSGQLLNEGRAAGSGGLPEEAPTGRFDEPEGIAIDNDPSSPSYGDVYVADTHGHAEGTGKVEQVIDKFSASGEYILGRSLITQTVLNSAKSVSGLSVMSRSTHMGTYGSRSITLALQNTKWRATLMGS
jgi:hypothetical protein